MTRKFGFALLTLVALSSSAAVTAASEDSDAQSIVMKNFHFAPVTLTVSAGATVTWKNLDEEPHTVASDSGLFRSAGLDQNVSFSFKFDKPGTYQFICSIHPSMRGTIIVK